MGMAGLALAATTNVAQVSPAVVVPPRPGPRTISLTWDYYLPMPQPRTVFELWCQTNATPPVPYWEYKAGKWKLLSTPWKITTNWFLFATTNKPPVVFKASLPNAIFAVRTVDTTTGRASKLAGK